jgi:acyl carrier protein
MIDPDRVLDVVAAVSGRPRDSLDAGTDLVSDLGFDSLRAFELVVALEEELGVEIQDQDVRAVRTLADVLAALARAQPRDP